MEGCAQAPRGPAPPRGTWAGRAARPLRGPGPVHGRRGAGAALVCFAAQKALPAAPRQGDTCQECHRAPPPCHPGPADPRMPGRDRAARGHARRTAWTRCPSLGGERLSLEFMVQDPHAKDCVLIRTVPEAFGRLKGNGENLDGWMDGWGSPLPAIRVRRVPVKPFEIPSGKPRSGHRRTRLANRQNSQGDKAPMPADSPQSSGVRTGQGGSRGALPLAKQTLTPSFAFASVRTRQKPSVEFFGLERTSADVGLSPK